MCSFWNWIGGGAAEKGNDLLKTTIMAGCATHNCYLSRNVFMKNSELLTTGLFDILVITWREQRQFPPGPDLVREGRAEEEKL
ncbi:hypothetical protein QR680_013916 [Steinernema hermaphroditum]|uniref:Uncharacterized protein n=1 Tax=Steinernema hermaphroditum TaxID=289476 RepID=A0AA39I9Q5_9BILA|nr:hypothetical protein QR680_013916 [Steinernema hermaphroditum]